jgi:Flp pilus assembly protein TadB
VAVATVTGAQLAALAGGLAGAGVFLALREAVLPPPRPDLAAVLARWDDPHPPAADGVGLRGRWATWLGAHATARLAGVQPADAELAGTSLPRLLAQRLAAVGLGLALPVILGLAGRLLGLPASPVVTGLVAITAAAALSFAPVLAVRGRVVRERESLRAAAGALLDLLAQERASGRSPTQALAEAAGIADSPPFTRIRSAITQAQRTGTSPWQALADLAARAGVTELADLADITASAAEGAAIYTTLTAKAAALRAAGLAEQRARANAESERLVLPVALLGLGFLLLIFYPAVIRLLTA